MNSKINFLFVLFVSQYYFTEENPNWKNLTKTLKDSVRESYGEKSKSRDHVSVGPRPGSFLDYPGNDTEKLKTIQKIWDDYYKCLNSKFNASGKSLTIPPNTVSSFTNSFIQLHCNLCVSPEDILEEAEWYFVRKPYLQKPILIEENELQQISAYTFNLNLYLLQHIHEGMYYCKTRADVDSPYFLHVLNSKTEPIKEVKSKHLNITLRPQKPLKIRDSNFILWNEWSSWTECSRCGKVGTRTRIGYCKISAVENVPAEISSNAEVSSKSLNIFSEIKNEMDNLLNVFIHGIPCRSPLLPKKIKESDIVKNYPTEISKGFCKVHCSGDVIVEVIDKDGKVIDKLNNTAGEYSILQDLPSNHVATQRVSVFADVDEVFVLSCPNNLNTNSPIEWSVGGNILIKNVLESVSNNRITINDLDEIVFYKFQEIDSKIYSCWRKKELAAVVNLKMNEKPSLINEYIATIELYPKLMYITIITTFCYVSITLCLNRSKAKIGGRVSKRRKRRFVRFLKDIHDDRYIPTIDNASTSKIK